MMRWPRATDSLRRRQMLTALAALLLAGLLVWLLLRPDSFGAAGGAARTGIFGQHPDGIASGDGHDSTGSRDLSGETNSVATNRNAVSSPAVPATTTSADEVTIVAGWDHSYYGVEKDGVTYRVSFMCISHEHVTIPDGPTTSATRGMRGYG